MPPIKSSGEASAKPSPLSAEPKTSGTASPKASAAAEKTTDQAARASDHLPPPSPGQVPATPHTPKPRTPVAAPVAAAEPAAPHRAIRLPAGASWQESRFSGQTSIELHYTPSPGEEPIKLRVHLSNRHQLTQTVFDGPEGDVAAREFENAMADLLHSVTTRNKLPSGWQRLQLTLTSSGALEKVTAFERGKVEQVDLDDKDGGLRTAARRFFNFWHGNDTATIENEGPVNVDPDWAEKRRREKQRARD